MQADDKTVANAFLAARRVEVELREMLKKDLDRFFGPSWRSHLPNSLINKWEQARNNEINKGRD